MLIQTQGIVFKSVKYSETSLICTIFTEELGVRQYIISGVRSSKAKTKANLFRPMNILDLVVYDRPNHSLNRIKEAKTACVYQSIPFELVKGTIGLFMIEVAQKTIKERVENTQLFNFLKETFVLLDLAQGSVANYPLFFLVQLSYHLGIMPSDHKPSDPCFFDLQEGLFVESRPSHNYFMNEDSSEIFHQVLSVPSFDAITEFKLAKPQRKRLLNDLIDYYRLHIESLTGLNAPAILREVLG